MLATKIFPETFRNFRNLLTRNQTIEQKLLKTTRNPFTQFHIANIYTISNLISTQLSEIQSEPVLKLLQSYHLIERKFDNTFCNRINTQISYDQNQHFFALKYFFEFNKALPLFETLEQLKQLQKLKTTHNDAINEKQQLSVRVRVRNCEQQKLDHPSIRKTLYFHEMKDLNDYIKYEFIDKTPLFIQDMNRKKLQIKVLDQKNPYGFPQKAPPLIFDVEIANKVYIRIKSTYQETNVIQVGSMRQMQKDEGVISLKRASGISGMKIPRNIQKLLYEEVLLNLLKIDEAEILKLHKLAYVGGRVQKLNILMDLHETMSMEDQDLFNKKMSRIL